MEQINVKSSNKGEIYLEIIPQIESLISDEEDIVANLGNIAAVLKYTFNFWWVGFYLIKNNSNGIKEMVLAPFQGPLACTRIQFGRGVCGTVWKEGRTIVVDDVDAFPGHIACSSLSRSEIVIPIFDSNGIFYGVLDIDSERLSAFDDIDAKYLEILASIICKKIK